MENVLNMKFLEIIVPEMKWKDGKPIKIEWNPSKKKSPFSIDYLFHGRKSDLKTQVTPFFTLEKFCGMNPSYSATFNNKDYDRYNTHKLHEKMGFIIFHICWIDFDGYGEKFNVDIEPIHGIWVAPFKTLKEKIESGNIYYHEYKERVGDKKGNSRGSYYFDIREMTELWRYR
jgi:hypothetical protein